MVRVICQALVHNRRLTLRWSESDRHFEPCFVEGEALHRFWEVVQDVQHHLQKLALSVEQNQEEQNRAAFALAQTGHQLFQHIFPETGPFEKLAAEIKGWLGQLHESGDLDSLEIVGDTVGTVPWNAVYETEPQEWEFQNAKPYSDCWGNFWGIRYDLTVTHRVNPLRTVELLEKPEVLLVVDRSLRQELPTDSREKLKHFIESNRLTCVETRDELVGALTASVPDVLYFFCRADTEGLRLGEAHVTAADLKEWLMDSEAGQVPWNNLLVIVNAAGAAPAGWDALKHDLFQLRFGGLIIPEYPLPAARVGQFGHDLLEGFLYIADSLGGLVQNKRSALAPFGLVYTVACPPTLQVSWEEKDGEESGEEENEADDAPPGRRVRPSLPLPEEPFHPIIPLDREDRSLLAGRDDDIGTIAEQIDSPRAPLFLLHGRPGVGKRSLLRSGVLPVLEEEAIGYHVLRDRTPDDNEASDENDLPIVPIRATQDLSGQLALALCAFAASSYTYTTPTERRVTVNLASVLRQVLHGEISTPSSTEITPSKKKRKGKSAKKADEEDSAGTGGADDGAVTPVELRQALLDDDQLLSRLLRELGERLPWELVLLIEQGDELFSLSRTGTDVRHRYQALAALCAVANQPSHARIVISLRTEYVGRLLARLQESLADPALVTDYLLSALSADQLVQVMQQPTLDEAAPYSTEIPFEKYQFRFDDELPRRIALEAIQAANEQSEEALPLVQSVCFLLCLQLEGRAGRTIGEADLKAVGGVKGGIYRYLERLWKSLVKPTDRRRLATLLYPLCRIQPDGLMTRELVAEDTFARQFPSRTPLATLVTVATAEDVQLLEETATVTDAGETSYFSLGHDAYVPPLVERFREEQLRNTGRGRIVDTLFIMIPLMILLGVVAYVFAFLPMGNRLVEERKAMKDLEKVFKEQVEPLLATAQGRLWPQYIGQMQQAQVAWQTNDMVRLQQMLWYLKTDFEPDRRGFEWYYLWQLAYSERATLEGHEGQVVALALSPDDKTLVSAALDDHVLLWDLAAQQRKRSIPVQPGLSGAVAYSANGERYALGFAKSIVIVDRKEPDKAHKLTGHEGTVTALAFAPDNKTLISAGEDKTIRLWNVEEKKEIAVLKDHKAPIRALALSPKGATFASADADNNVFVWDLKKQKKLYVLKGQEAVVEALTYAADGKKLATAGTHSTGGFAHGLVEFWDAATGKKTAKNIPTPAPILALLFTPDGKTVITGDKANIIHLWDAATGNAGGVFKGHVGWVNCLAITKKGDKLISGSADGVVKIWDLPIPPSVIHAHDGWILSAAVSPDNKQAASGGRDGTIKIWELATGKELHALAKHSGAVTALAYAKSGKKQLLASGSSGTDKETGQLFIWDAAKGEIVKELKGHKKGITSLALSEDGKTLVSAGLDGAVLIWDVDKGEVKTTVTGDHGIIRAVALDAGAKQLAFAGDEGEIHLWDMTSSELLTKPDKKMTGHIGPIYALAYHVSDSVLASAGADRTIRLWEVNKQIQFESFPAHTETIFSLTFTPLGESLVSASADDTVKIWYILRNRGLPSFTFTEHTAPVRAVAFSPDQRTLISAGNDGTIQIRRAAPPEMPEKKK